MVGLLLFITEGGTLLLRLVWRLLLEDVCVPLHVAWFSLGGTSMSSTLMNAFGPVGPGDRMMPCVPEVKVGAGDTRPEGID